MVDWLLIIWLLSIWWGSPTGGFLALEPSVAKILYPPPPIHTPRELYGLSWGACGGGWGGGHLLSPTSTHSLWWREVWPIHYDHSSQRLKPLGYRYVYKDVYKIFILNWLNDHLNKYKYWENMSGHPSKCRLKNMLLNLSDLKKISNILRYQMSTNY